ncbi:M1 family metallopeptidase [Ferruginibacter sp. HRS2-29]|uniref:M1 family metallopeptidase n=1 Tax=Ferruginibacter sp. HRS2-29 TaxID=2487334 RepID=UPI0020CE70BD|nr:M1 family metallopeptidase [Ferruginibacter sp. HRS2-29]MCP9750351.1 M1 family peptidase [Ferruginibacter sp. HRS2-29]
MNTTGKPLQRKNSIASTLVKISSLLLSLAISQASIAQSFTRQDTLRGSIGPGRIGWDVLKYDITVQPDFAAKTIRGKNNITYYDAGVKLMQIDLQEPMQIDSIVSNGKSLSFTRDGNVFYTQIRDTSRMYKIRPGVRNVLIYFSGKPKEAVKAPWDGGWIWTKDKQGAPWMTVACQGLGASVWYPCKDVQSDEPDSGALMHMIVPDSLVGVSNGRMTEKKILGDGTTRYSWKVISPINNYNIVPYIGKYVHFGETFKGEKGKLDMDYWVMEYNLDSAKKQFVQAPLMMKAFEHWFGPYPFYADGYKLVETPFLGMEHQSAVAYGNRYRNGYLGNDLSKTGWGLKWDFILVHESGHEWFANNITTKDIADMWVHEGFTNYSETLFTEYYYGKEAAKEYEIGLRKLVKNKQPSITHYGVNEDYPDTDIYYKASNMIHTIRQLIGNDVLFREILRGLNKTFYHQTVTTRQVEDYIIKKSGKKLQKVFDQYLRNSNLPVLEYKLDGYTLHYRYAECVDGFNMPLKINFKGSRWITPTAQWKTLSMYPEGDKTFSVDSNFYVLAKEIK